jgi:hypothetical protein
MRRVDEYIPWRSKSGIAASMINPVRGSVTTLRVVAGLSGRRDRYQRGRTYSITLVIQGGNKRSRVTISRRPIKVGCIQYTSFDFTEGGSAFSTIIPSLTDTNELYNLAVTCPHEIQLT